VEQCKEKEEERELTLSDIIAPPAHARTVYLTQNPTTSADAALATSTQADSNSTHANYHSTDPSLDLELDISALEDDSMLKSIYDKILEGLPLAVPRPKRVDPGVATVVSSEPRYDGFYVMVYYFFSLELTCPFLKKIG
jgi:hypothetical protein